VELLARSTDYAIRALLHMAARKDVLISTADLDRDLKLPRPFMRKTLQALQKAGYLESIKGHKGGFRMSRPAQEIRLMDLMKVFQGNISLGDCLFKKKVCSCVRTCPLRREIKSIETMVLKRLSGLTLADLLRG
jgi:Rrf2 family protein